MSFKINTLKESPTGKRYDLTVTVRNFLTQPYELEIRILGREEIHKDNIEDIVEEVIDRQRKAKQGKKHKILSLSQYNANAYFNKK